MAARGTRAAACESFVGRIAPEFSGVEALRAGLRDLGYIEGTKIASLCSGSLLAVDAAVAFSNR